MQLVNCVLGRSVDAELDGKRGVEGFEANSRVNRDDGIDTGSEGDVRKSPTPSIEHPLSRAVLLYPAAGKIGVGLKDAGDKLVHLTDLLRVVFGVLEDVGDLGIDLREAVEGGGRGSRVGLLVRTKAQD